VYPTNLTSPISRLVHACLVQRCGTNDEQVVSRGLQSRCRKERGRSSRGRKDNSCARKARRVRLSDRGIRKERFSESML